MAMNSTKPTQPQARMVVAIDFGTTYSGFAYALTSDIEKVYTFFEWPGQHVAEAKPYCKTQTSLWYMPGSASDSKDYDLKDWGWPAFSKYKKALQDARGPRTFVDHAHELKSSGYFATKFKLHLAPTSLSLGTQLFFLSHLPHGLTAKRLISDYLKCLSDFIMETLHNSYGSFISKDVQWCLTVPALWDDAAKHQMVECAEISGLVRGALCTDNFASLHPLIMVLEPEAASIYCQRKLKDVEFTKGSKFLVADVGGGTVDLVVHEKVDDSGIKVKEISCSTADLCGGTYVDEAFYRFLSKRISCFEEFSAKHPATVLRIQEYIEKVKCSFDGETGSFLDYLKVPPGLAKAWKSSDKIRDRRRKKGSYDTLAVSREDVVSIFREVVEKILRLIGEQLDANPKVEAILVVGGFSSSPYLMSSSKVDRILNPVDPGSAVCQVLLPSEP